MTIFQNKENKSICFRGPNLQVICCDDKSIISFWICSISPLWNNAWEKINLPAMPELEVLSKLIHSSGGIDNNMELSNWLAANQKALVDICLVAKLSAIPQAEKVHLRKIN